MEYAKAGPEDLLVRIDVVNRGPEAGELHVLPTLWFRNTWSWGGGSKPSLERVEHPAASVIATHHTVSLTEGALPDYHLYCEGKPALLFTENETNAQRLWGQPNPSPYVKDGIDESVVHGRPDAVNPAGAGTKVSAHVPLTIGPGETRTVRLRLTRSSPGAVPGPFADHDRVFEQRRREADVFYERHHPSGGAGRRRPGAGDAPGARRDALEQAVLPLRPGHLAPGAPGGSRIALRGSDSGCGTPSGST